jgi:hypothetical protein
MRCALFSVDQPRQQEHAAQALGRAGGSRFHVVTERRQFLVDLLDALAPSAGLHLVHRQHHAQCEQVANQSCVAVFDGVGVGHCVDSSDASEHLTARSGSVSEAVETRVDLHLPAA